MICTKNRLVGFFVSIAMMPHAHALNVKVILLGGQSNSVGQAASTGLPTSPVNLRNPQADVLFYYDGGPGLTTLCPGSGGNPSPTGLHFGPEVTFGRAIANASPSAAYAIIKHGENGTALYDDWAPGTGPSYSRFKATVAAGLTALQNAGHSTEIVGMLWLQGESDALEGQQANYQTNLTNFIADIRIHYGANLPFFIGGIYPQSAAKITVINAQTAVAAADPYSTFFSTGDLNIVDAHHFDAASLMTIGERYAAAFHALPYRVVSGVSIKDYSSQLAATRAPKFTIDSSGFTEVTGYHSNAANNTMWNNQGLISGGTDNLPTFITFDLGRNYDLASTKVWNWNDAGTLTAGSRNVEISVASSVTGSFTSIGNFVLSQGPGTTNVDFGQVIDFSGFPAAGDVRLVRFDIITNYGYNTGGSTLAGLSEVRFMVAEEVDETPPTISNVSPASGKNFVSVTSNLQATFNENITFGTGVITIKRISGEVVESIDVTSSPRVTISGSTLTIDPTSDLDNGTLYYLEIAGTAIADLAGNSFPGITGSATWSFTTLAAGASTIIGVTIGDYSSQFNNSNRVVENIINGTGFTEATGYHTSADVGHWNNLGFGLGTTVGDDPFPVTVTLDLEANHDLSYVKIWNWNQSSTTTAGSKDVEVLVASSVGGPFNSLGSFVLTKAPGSDNVDFGQVIDLTGFAAADDARLVRFSITSNHGYAYQLAGFSEVRFTGAPVADFNAYISDPELGLDPEDQGLDSDPDFDQIPNGVEAWFGTHPGEFNAGITKLGTNGTITTFEHPQNESPPSDLTGFYQWSINFVDWYDGDGTDGPGGGGPTVTISADSVGTTTTVTATASEVLGKLFLRAGIIQD